MVSSSAYAGEEILALWKDPIYQEFSETTAIMPIKVTLSKSERADLSKQVRSPADREYTLFKVLKKDVILGYILIDNIIGKHQPITFLVSLNPEGSIRRTKVLAYRESVGGEIQNSKFLDQFKAKSLKDPFCIGRDIDGITGATLSVRATAAASKKAVLLYKIGIEKGIK